MRKARKRILAVLVVAVLLLTCGSSFAFAAGSKTGKEDTETVETVKNTETDDALEIMAAAQLGDDQEDTEEDIKEDTKESIKETVLEDAQEEEISITLSDKKSIASDSSVTISGSTVTITQEGTYRISGTLSDGQILIDAGEDAKVKLILDGADISKEGSAAIYAITADKLILSSAEGSVNKINSTGEFVQADDNNVDAAVFAKCDLNLNGEGLVNISCETGHGVVTKDDLKVKAGEWNIEAAGKGLSGKESITVEDGTLNIICSGKGIFSSNDENEEEGVIEILGGSITVVSEDDSIHAGNTVTISSGELALSSEDDGIHADNILTVTDGNIDILKCYEGLEAKDIDISGGIINITARDDGINAAGGNDGSNAFGPFGGDPFGSDSGSVLNISGGTITVDADGDGLDANGELNVSGGLIYVSGPTSNGNGALDYGTGASITGGTVIAAGSSGMAENFGSGSTQGSILLNLSSAQAAGSTVTIEDEDGEVLASFSPTKSYQSVVISTEGMTEGGTYTVKAGTVSETVTLDSVIYGNGMGMGGFGGGPGGFGGQMGGLGWNKDDRDDADWEDFDLGDGEENGFPGRPGGFGGHGRMDGSGRTDGGREEFDFDDFYWDNSDWESFPGRMGGPGGLGKMDGSCQTESDLDQAG